MSVLTDLLVLVTVGMVGREDTSLPCQVTRLHWEARVSVQCPQ